MSNMPSPKKCLELLKKSGCSDSVIRHCKAVRDIAVKIAKKTDADVKLVEVGALLHDMGRSKTHDVFHGVEGAKIAKKFDLPRNIILIIERHLGAGIPMEEAVKLGLPPKDYLPMTLEEKIVCHADNLIDKNRCQNIESEIQAALKKGFKKYAQRLRQLHQELSDICGVDLNDI